MTLTVDPQGHLFGALTIESDWMLPKDNAAFGVTHLSDGTFVVTASVTSCPPTCRSR